MNYFRDTWGAPDADEPPSFFKAAAKQLGIPLPPDVDPSNPPSFFRDAARTLGLPDPLGSANLLRLYAGELPISDAWNMPLAQTSPSPGASEPLAGEASPKPSGSANPKPDGGPGDGEFPVAEYNSPRSLACNSALTQCLYRAMGDPRLRQLCAKSMDQCVNTSVPIVFPGGISVR